MKSDVERATAALIGKTLWRSNRAADLEAFHFSSKQDGRKGRWGAMQVGEYALHVQCPWRIIAADQVIVGNGDLYYPAGISVYSIDFDWDREPNRRDELLTSFFEGGIKQFLVQRIEVGDAGSFCVLLEGGVSLEVFPSDAAGEEHWRLFKPGSHEPHFVVGRGAGPAVL